MSQNPTPPPPTDPPNASTQSIDAALTLEELVAVGEPEPLLAFVRETPAGEMARAVARLEPDQRSAMCDVLSPEAVAFVVEELSDDLAADVLEELEPAKAADIVEALPSDSRADLLGELSKRDAEAILEAMEAEEAREARELSAYDEETAGGLMVTEYLSYRETTPIDDILADLRQHADRYHGYDVQYLYVTDVKDTLIGVLRLRDLVMTPGRKTASEVMIPQPLSVRDTAELEELEDFFDSHRFFAVPVTDAEGRLVGVVRRASVDEQTEKRQTKSFLRFAGILTGEERRDSPTFSRAGRRLVFLAPNIVLNLIAVSVIASFQGTLEQVVALAIFLPILSDMSGCSGNQAVAVSMRELALGLVKPKEIVRTLMKEVSVGMINGMLLGILLGLIAWGMRGDEFAPIGIVVGLALMLNSIVAVAVGGCVPLVLKRFGTDPAMASGPVLTTITDLCGFFLALFLTSQFLAFQGAGGV
ncbi:MAG: magnesium transporter [Phycisphaeraceae bacterium]